MASDTSDLLLFGALGLGAYYLYAKNQEEQALARKQQTVIVGAPQPDVGVALIPDAAPADPVGQIVDPIASMTSLIASKIPIVGPIIAPIVGPTVDVYATAAIETIQGNLSTGNILTDVSLLCVPCWPFLGLGKLLHIDLFGHDLDNVHHILLNAFNSPIGQDNVQFGKPVYFLDGDQILHEIVDPSNILNKAGFSWRSIIAVPQLVIDFFQIGTPLFGIADAKNPPPAGIAPTTMSFAERPATSAGIRAYFGCDAIFKVGNDQQLYGPYPGMSGPALDCSSRPETAPLPGSPAEMLAKVRAAAAARRPGRF